METCHSDERVVAVFLRGSYLTAITDNYSDLDLGLITLEQAYHDFLEEITAFISRLDELLAIQKTLLKID